MIEVVVTDQLLFYKLPLLALANLCKNKEVGHHTVLTADTDADISNICIYIV